MKNLSRIKWGWKKDLEDKRDLPAHKLIFAEVPLPPVYWCNPHTPIYNQGSTPACTGFALAGVKSDEEFLQHKQELTFSGGWLYGEEKKIDGIPDEAGSYLRFGLKILQQQGSRETKAVCSIVNLQPDSYWKIKGYYRIDNASPPTFIKQVIYQYGSIAVGSYWYDSWMNVQQVFPKPDRQIGGHAYRICGWNDDEGGWIVVNSWGKVLWGVNGTAIMPYDVFTDAVLNEGADCWKILDA